MKSVIFDLDLTLVDTSILEKYRKERNWSKVYEYIPLIHLYDGLSNVFEYLNQKNVNIAIVSTAPHIYVEKVVKEFSIPCNYIVGYHDAKPIKPHPAPMLKALELLHSQAKNAISFGDRAIDIISSNAANISSVACTWGTKERELLLSSSYSYCIDDPNKIIELLNI